MARRKRSQTVSNGIALLISLLLLSGCGGGGGGSDAASVTTPPPTPDPSPWTFETLSQLSDDYQGETRNVAYVRATHQDGTKTYMMTITTPSLAAKAPTVVVLEPYAGIDWSGEEVDSRWAKLAPGRHPDVDGPNYNGTDEINYKLQELKNAMDNSLVWLVNGFQVIRVYGRFYAGGDMNNDIADGTAAYFYIDEHKDRFDPQHIGAIGGSWGGLMALFGAAKAPVQATPKAVAATSPPSQLADLWDYAETLPGIFPDPDAAEGFFSPYLRRIAPSTGGRPGVGDFSGYSHQALCSHLKAPVLVVHDAWDTLIPVSQSEDFAASCPDKVAALIWQRQTPVDYFAVGLDHGPFSKDGDYPAAYAFATTWIGLAISDPQEHVVTLLSNDSMAIFLNLVHAEQLAGHDVSTPLEALRQFVQTRVVVFDPATSTYSPSAEVMAPLVNAEWGTHYTAEGLRTALESSLPPP